MPLASLTGADGVANVALMTLAVPQQSKQRSEAMALALYLTNAANQERFATEARVLPSSVEALRQVQRALEQEQPRDPSQAQIRDARLLSAITLQRARVLVPAMPGIKRLQKILYTQLQRSMLNQISSDQAISTAAEQWNSYAEARWP
jgi:putative chitobiose transport system substrate-binding protein